MKLLLGLILLAVMLSGCAREPRPTTCPAPAGELLVAPPTLERLPPGRMTQQDALTAWLNDIEAFRLQRARLVGLQDWGRARCGWGSPVGGQ